MPDEKVELIGRLLGGYRIESALGQGSDGTVYLASHPAFAADVALKVMSEGVAERPGARERFLRESRWTASLDHPSVIPILAVGESGGVPYFVMKYAEGGDLRALLDRVGRLSLTTTVDVIEQVASALDAAHSASLLHLDLKLTNILLGAGGRVYLSDFGGARLVMPTGPGEVPDPYGRDLVSTSAWRDIHGLGHVAHQCLSGQQPFELAAFEANRRGVLPRVATSRPEIPSAVDDVLAGAVTTPPNAKYPTAGSMARALRLAALGSPSAGAERRTRRYRLRRWG